MFFSKVHNQGCIRRGDATQIMPTVEFYSQLNSKLSAKVLVSLELTDYNQNGHRFNFKYGIFLKNVGFKPGFYIMGPIRVSSSPVSIIKLTGNTVKVIGSSNTKQAQDCQFSAGFPPNTYPIYPGSNLTLGILEIGDLTHIFVTLYEQASKSTQQFEVLHNSFNPVIAATSEKTESYW